MKTTKFHVKPQKFKGGPEKDVARSLSPKNTSEEETAVKMPDGPELREHFSL